MAKIRKICDVNNGRKCAQNHGSLDTLAQMATNRVNRGENCDFDNLSALVNKEDKPTLKKRAKRKYFTSKLVPYLADAAESRGDYQMRKSYWSSYHCCKELFVRVDGKVVSSGYCKQRWCLVCASIRTASMINKYTSIIEGWGGKQFATLTERNCTWGELPKRIEEMHKIVRKIVKSQSRRYQRGKSDWCFMGIRKFECTYNPVTNTFHPHFHFILANLQMAIHMIENWLKMNDRSEPWCQDTRFTTAGSEKELFKYETKMVTSSSNHGKKGGRYVYSAALDWIYANVRGKRTFDRIGFKLSDYDSHDYEQKTPSPVLEIHGWEDIDWVNVNGEVLTGFIPSKGLDDLLDNCVIPF